MDFPNLHHDADTQTDRPVGDIRHLSYHIPLHSTSYLTAPYSIPPTNANFEQSNSSGLVQFVTEAHHSPTLQELQLPLTHTTSGSYEQRFQRLADESNGYPPVFVYNNTNAINYTGSSLPFPPLPVQLEQASNSGSLPQGLDQSDYWIILRTPQQSFIDNPDSDSNPNSLGNQASQINVASPGSPPNQPIGWMDPKAFRELPGYHGEKNTYNRFDCFGGCWKARFGKRGFSRRANMLAHLRSCHGQTIPRRAPVKLL